MTSDDKKRDNRHSHVTERPTLGWPGRRRPRRRQSRRRQPQRRPARRSQSRWQPGTARPRGGLARFQPAPLRHVRRQALRAWQRLRRRQRRGWRQPPRAPRLFLQAVPRRLRRARGAGARGLAGERPVYGGRQPARRRAAPRRVRRHHRARPALAPAGALRDPRDRRPHRRAHGRGGLSRLRAQQGAARVADAHGRREHHQHPVRRAVRAQQPGELRLQQPLPRRGRGPGCRDRDARDRRQEPNGLRALRGPRGDRDYRARAHAAHPRPLRDRHPGQPRDHAERPAARAGAGRVRRRGQGRPGPRAPEERGRGLRQRRRAACAGYRLAPGRRGQRLPRARGRQRRG